MSIHQCDYCGHTYRLDTYDPDKPPTVHGESKCMSCGEPRKNAPMESESRSDTKAGCYNNGFDTQRV